MKQVMVALALSSFLPLVGETMCQAGAVDGQRRWSERVEAQQEMVYNIRFIGGQTAEFAILGDSATDVDIFVYDEDGRLVTFDVGLSDLGMVRWTPTHTQNFRIVVRNLGSVWNRVNLGHN